MWGLEWKKTNWQNKWMGDMVKGECKNWQRKSYITQTNYKHYEGGYGRLPLGDVYTWHGFLSRTCKFEKIDSITFFTSLLKDLSTEDLVTLGNLLSTKFLELNIRFYATPCKWAWVP